jgi:disulfide bond formation protein DsbB
MSEATVSPILATGALLTVTLAVAAGLGAGAPGAHQLRALLLARGRWLTFAVAAAAMAASLYYSEVAGFIPCEFCWYQRIAMYPLAVVGLVAALSADARAWRYIVPIAAAGLLLSAYHYQMQLFPSTATACVGGVPCSARYVNVLGFVTIPFMAGASFIAILALQVGMLRSARLETSAED